MPRKPKPKPVPDRTFTQTTIYGQELVFEVFENTFKVHGGQGSFRKNLHEERFGEALQIAASDYLTPDGLVRPKNDYLISASKFSFYMSEHMKTLDRDSGDDSALRKTIYPRVVKEIWALSRVIYEMNRGTL